MVASQKRSGVARGRVKLEGGAKRLIVVAGIFTILAVVPALVFSFGASTSDDGGPTNPRQPESCSWLAGDVDVHTTYSFSERARDRRIEGAIESGLSVAEQGRFAEERGLNFLAITDFDDLRSVDDPAYGSARLIWIPGYEALSEAGDAQVLGSDRVVEPTRESTTGLRALIETAHSRGALVQIAHPGDGRWERANGTALTPDAVEVWAAGPWGFAPETLVKNGGRAAGLFDRLLDAGSRIALTGGSNSLLRTLTSLSGVGQPTTWVCSEERSSRGVIDGIASGRTSVSHEPPATGNPFAEGAQVATRGLVTTPPPDTEAPFAFIEADDDGDGEYESLSGDAVSSGAPVRIGVFGAPLATLRLVGDGSEVVDQVEVSSPAFVHDYEAPKDLSWIRAEVFVPEQGVAGCDLLGPSRAGREVSYCGDRIGMLALTSPLYFANDS
jgi:hypothetical protein